MFEQLITTHLPLPSEGLAEPCIEPAMVASALQALMDAQVVALTLRRNRGAVPRLLKADLTPVTAADLAVQAIIASALRQADPRTPIVAEEELTSLRRKAGERVMMFAAAAAQCVRPDLDRVGLAAAIDTCTHQTSATEFWTLDPIDGTKGFMRGDHFAIALARIRDGDVMFAALACPTLFTPPAQSLLMAFRGGGAWRLDDDVWKRLTLGTECPVRFRICESTESAHSNHELVARIAAMAGASDSTLRIDSQAKYALVAHGDAEAYLRVPLPTAPPDAIWDHAAGNLIAREAGAIVTDLRARPLDFGHGSRLVANCGIVCAHPAVHERLIAAIAAGTRDPARQPTCTTR